MWYWGKAIIKMDKTIIGILKNHYVMEKINQNNIEKNAIEIY